MPFVRLSGLDRPVTVFRDADTGAVVRVVEGRPQDGPLTLHLPMNDFPRWSFGVAPGRREIKE